MRVLGRERLTAFCAKHADARPWIEAWLAEVEKAVWTGPTDIKARYASASVLNGKTMIFNVKGNNYRLEVDVVWRTHLVIVVWVGTHAEYDRRNASRRG